MRRALRWSIEASVAVAVAGFTIACSGGGNGGDGDGDGDGDVVGFTFNEASMEFAAGLGARVVDAFPPVTDLLTPALIALADGTTRSGEARALHACASGTASLVWNDRSGDGTWSAGDTARIELAGCRVHAGDGVVLGGALQLTFSSVIRGPPHSLSSTLELALDTDDGQPGTLRGLVMLAATSVDGEHHGLVFRPAGAGLLTATGSMPFQLGCFDVRDDPDPALGFTRRVAIGGVIRTGDAIISFDPGARLLYVPNDVPGDGRLGLLSIAMPLCTDIGVDSGGVRSDMSMVSVIATGGGDMRVELYRAGSTQPDHADACSWNDLLHSTVGGVINGTNVVGVAGVALSALDLPRQVGGTGLDLVLGIVSGQPVPICTGGGGYSVSITPGPVAVGHVATVTFTNCVTGEPFDPVTLGGSLTFTVGGVAGDPTTDTYSLATTVSAIDIGVADDVGESRITGAFRFARTAVAGAITDQSDSQPGATLALREGAGDDATETRLTAFAVQAERPASPGFTMASPGDTMRIEATGISGELAVSVTAAVSGVEPDPPHTGDLDITAADGSNVAVQMASGGAITLQLDANGDGVVDATIPTTWDALD